MYTPAGDAMIHRTRREEKSRKNDDSDGDNGKNNGNDSSATTSDGLLPLTNPVIVHLEG